MEIPVQTRDAMGLNLIADEIKKARALHGPMNSAHEAYSVILEEVDEFWTEVKKKRQYRDHDNMLKELVQVAAMCVRAMTDLKLQRGDL